MPVLLKVDPLCSVAVVAIRVALWCRENLLHPGLMPVHLIFDTLAEIFDQVRIHGFPLFWVMVWRVRR